MSMKLNRDDTISIINIYGQHECLWNIRKKSYKSNSLKKAAWESIANHFGTDVDEVKKKVKYLRTAYVAERKKYEELKKNNPAENYQPKLFYYNEFHYLENSVVRRKTDASDDEEASNSVPDYIQENESVWEKCATDEYLEEDFPPPEEIKKRKSSTQLEPETIQIMNGFAKRPKTNSSRLATPQTSLGVDMYYVFGKSVGLQLRNLRTVNAAKAMAQIQETLTEFAVSEEQ